MNAALFKALEQLDVDNDDHWTSDGSPRLDMVKSIYGQDVTRAEIKSEAPTFNRQNASVQPGPVDAVPEEQPEEQDDEDTFKTLNAELAHATKIVKEAQDKRQIIVDKLDALILKREGNPESPAESIKRYQKAQQAQRVSHNQKVRDLAEKLANSQ